MGILDRFLPKQRIEVVLPALRSAVGDAALAVASRPVAPALVTARIADHVRSAGGEPMAPVVWDDLVATFDDATWRRLAVAGTALSRLPLEKVVAAGVIVQRECAAVASQTPLLTLDLLRAVPLRAEEFARKLAAATGVGIVGEDDAVSRTQLGRLDYGRLLAEAERAKAESAERLKQIEALRAQQGPRRGKW